MHQYRTHKNNELRQIHESQTVRLSGWVHAKRNHGGILFIDLRDHYGITQCVISENLIDIASDIRLESVITITGIVSLRPLDTKNDKLPTGEIEVKVSELVIQSNAEILPFPIANGDKSSEELRLSHRFLDLRTEKMHSNIMLRSNVIALLRKLMQEQNFTEIQTPILTNSSPEGARDFLVPSRLHPGKFYALPQAPQQYKQLLMVSGFDRYFQIAPCFRDEASRADRSPGEFYQLDFEMSFVTQEEVFDTIEPVLHEVFKTFSKLNVSEPPFIRIPYDEAMVKYGTDKPDLRYPVEIIDMTEEFRDSSFTPFAEAIKKGAVVRAVPGMNVGGSPRSYYKELDSYMTEQGAAGLAYINFGDNGLRSPLIKFIGEERTLDIFKNNAHLNPKDALFFICDKPKQAANLSGKLRMKLAEGDYLFEKDTFKFCWITDFPMYELDEETGKIDFCHNPFSMPQGGMDALNNQDPLTIKAYQYDIICNGVELSSGAIRNHIPEIMIKAFSIAGYEEKNVVEKFGGMLNAFKFGAPPHGGAAPGIDRMVMLLADEPNIREIIPFPLNQKGEDLLMGSPSTITDIRLKELSLKLDIRK